MHTSLSRRGFVSSLAAGVLCANDGWVDLFNGRDLSGWRQVNGTAPFAVVEGTIVGTTVAGSPNSFLNHSNGDSPLEWS